MSRSKARKAKARSRNQSGYDEDEQDALFKLSFEEALDDPQIAAKMAAIMRTANKEILDSISSLRQEVKHLKAAVAERDATITELQGEVAKLHLQNDALEQYGRRSSLRFSGVSEEFENSTDGVLEVANNIMELDPPLRREDITISHILPKPRGAPAREPRSIIVRFISKEERNRVISNRKELKKHNQENDARIYINEDLTAFRSKLFSIVRRLQKRQYFSQCWTYNGNIKVKDTQGHVRSISCYEDIKSLLPNVDINRLE